MKDTIKIIKIKSKKERYGCIVFLKENCSLNLYLYEGIAKFNPLFNNFYVKRYKEIVGVIHTKNGEFIHIFFSKILIDNDISFITKLILKKFKKIKVVFGDYASIIEFMGECYLNPIEIKKYNFMEVNLGIFKSIKKYQASVPDPQIADLFLPLQIGYEIEEMGVDRSVFNRDKMLYVLRNRLKKKEITAIFHKNLPLAMAGVNARFENTCQIGSIYVIPQYRKKGYGISVVSSHIEHLFNKYNRIVLFVDEKNESAYNLYKKIGFLTKGQLIKTCFEK